MGTENKMFHLFRKKTVKDLEKRVTDDKVKVDNDLFS